MKTRAEILEETRLFLAQIDPAIFRDLMLYIGKIDYQEIDKLPAKEITTLMRGEPSATIGALTTLMKLSNLAKFTAPGHFGDES